MKSQKKVRSFSLMQLVLAMLMVSVIIVLTAPVPVLAQPGTTYPGTTILDFSDNPAILSGDGAIDVTITTTTTATGALQELIDDGRVTIQLATDGLGNPVPAAEVVDWIALNAPGQNPVIGVTTLDVDLDVLGFDCGTVGGFRAHYVTGGGRDKVGTHFSDAVDLTSVCDCPCDETESAFAYDELLGICFLDIPDLTPDRWGWTIGPLDEGEYEFEIWAAAGQCELSNGILVGTLRVVYADGTATVTYLMDTCRILTETHLYIGDDILPTHNDKPTVAPGHYGNIHDGDEALNAEFDQYVIDGLSDEIYLIAHAVVCVEPEPEPVDED